MMILPTSYRQRLTLGAVCIVALMFGLLVLLATVHEEQSLKQHSRQAMQVLAKSIQVTALKPFVTRDYISLQEIITPLAELPDLREALIQDETGLVLAHTNEERIGQYASLPYTSQETSSSPRILRYPIETQGKVAGWLILLPEHTKSATDIDGLWWRAGIFTFVAILLVWAGAAWAFKSLFGRLLSIEQTVRSVSNGQKHLRTNLTGRDEVSLIAQQFDVMLDQIEAGERELNTLFSAVPDGLLVVNEEGKILRVNSGCCDIFGYQEDELVGNTIDDLVPIEYRRHHAAKRASFLDMANRDHSFELSGLHKNGQQIPLQIALRRIELQGSTRVICTLKNISESKLQADKLNSLNKQLSISEARFKGAAQAAGVGLWMWDIAANTLVWDKGMYELYGVADQTSDQPVDYTMWSNRVHPEDLAGAEQGLNELLTGKGKYDREFRIVLPDGSMKCIHATAFLEYDDNAQPRFMVGLNQDITKLKLSEERLKEALIEAEIANGAKSRFLGAVSHELRTPLNGINGLLFSLLKHVNSDRARSELEKLAGAVEHLNGLINQVLDINKIEHGKLELNLEPLSISLMTETAVSIVSDSAQLKDISLKLKNDCDLPEFVLGDAQRLRQMLLNYLSNAIKFTPSGGHVRLETEVLSLIDNQASIRFTVVDSGIGVAEANHDRLFKMFEQAHSGVAKTFGGSGLGLSLVKNLAEQMGGKVGFTSTEGLGSRFWFEVNLVVSEKAPNREKDYKVELPLDCLNGTNLLVVDDNELNVLVAENIFKVYGASVLSASNGALAIETLKKYPDISAVLMDVQMPVMDGLEATRRIKSNPLWRDIRIIGLTGAAMDSDVQAAYDAGMDTVLIKPLDPEKLVSACMRVS